MPRTIVIIILTFIINALTQAQPYKNPKYGPDSVSRLQCAKNLSVLSSYMEIELYTYALDAFQAVMNTCPGASKNIYVHGAKIYKYLIENEPDSSIRARRTDSLMLIYDLRIQYFKEEGLVFGKKGLDLYRYTDRLQDAYSLMKRSIDIMKEQSEDAVIAGLMQVSVLMMKKGMHTQSDFLSDYALISTQLETRKKNNLNPEKTEKLEGTISGLLLSLETMDCSSLDNMLLPAYEANKNDSIWLQKTISLLQTNKCQESKLYTLCLEQTFRNKPSAETAGALGNLFFQRKDYQMSADYLMKAKEMESDQVKKSKYLYMIAVVKSQDAAQYAEARSYAQQAIKLNESWGEPYLLIGNMYAMSSKTCGSNDFEQKAIFWLAADQFMKAKAVDVSVTEEANRLINQYSPFFPNKENAFFYGYTEGNTYKAGCWINESTRVRF